MEVKDYIIQETDKLFCQFGFKSVTMDDIAKHLGISKKTIYQHFVDKNELVNILMENKLNARVCSIEDQRKADNAVHEVYMGIEDLNNTLLQMNPKLLYDLNKYHPDAWLKFRNFREKQVCKAIIQNLKRGVAEGYYREEINLDIIAAMRLDQIDILFTQKIESLNNSHNLAKIMEEITLHFLYGIVNNKGLALIEKYEKTRKTQNYA